MSAEDIKRLSELSMPTALAKEVVAQIAAGGGGGGGAVNSVNGQTGTVVLDAADVGALADDGTAAAATSLATARTFSITGDVAAAGVTFDGTGNVTLNTGISSGVIVNADINPSAAIALTKLATGALPTGITIASANIVDGTITNADISASAAIALTKLSDFSGGVTAIVTPAITAAKQGGTANTASGSTTINAANHNGQPWQITSAGAATVTLDDDLPQGSEITIYSLGAGVVTIASESGTINVLGGADPELPGQYSAGFVRKTGASTYTLIVGVPGTGGSGIESVVAGAGIDIDDTDPANPVISATAGGGEVVLFADNTATASYTGVTTEQTIAEWSVVIPAGTIGPNSEIVIDAFYAHGAGNTNVKTFRAKIGGTNLIAYPSPANAVPVRVRKSVFSNDSASSQFQFTAAANDITAVSGTSVQTNSIDFSVEQTLICTIQLAVDTDTFVGRRLRVTVRDAA